MKYLIHALRHPSEYDWRHLRPWQKHSEVLGVAGTVYIGIGASLLRPPNDARLQALGILFDLMPPVAWGAVWICVGVLAIASTRWPQASKTWGYTALTGITALWGTGYAVGVVFDNAPTFGLVGALIYWLFSYLWFAIAGLANPDDLYQYGLLPEETDADPGT